MRRRSGMADEQLVAPNSENTYEVTGQDLPLHCPMPGMYLWNSHPKVFLPIEESGSAICPYCSASYHLTQQSDSTG